MSDFQKDFLHGPRLRGWPLQGQQPAKNSGCDSNNRVHVRFDFPAGIEHKVGCDKSQPAL